jgi:hypothetical protein
MQFEKRFVSGLRFSDAADIREIPNGFSHWLSPSAPQRASVANVVGCVKAGPDANRFSNCTTTEQGKV